MPAKKKTSRTKVTAHTHKGDKRKNIPNQEHESVLTDEDREVKTLRYPRNTDFDPQLVWRSKDQQDATDLQVPAPPIYIQEKIHPKALIDDLKEETARQERGQEAPDQLDLFADFNGIPKGVDKTEFYQHDQNWSNRMILGDSLQVMGSLAEREGLRGKVQCIYLDPPYGIKFNSNFQWSTTSRDVKDGKAEHITREPEMVKAFRDTWRDGIHSYLTYLRDRLTVARDLLTDSGSIFVQIGDENVHRVRCLMDEVFGEENFVSEIACSKTSSSSEGALSGVFDYVIWYAKSFESIKYRQLFHIKVAGDSGGTGYRRIVNSFGEERPASSDELDEPSQLAHDEKLYASDNLTSQRPAGESDLKYYTLKGQTVTPGKGTFKSDLRGIRNLHKANRVIVTSGKKPAYRRYLDDFPVYSQTNMWTDTLGQNQFGGEKVYVVQTAISIVQRCVIMATDPGDLVLDPTCGSGTTATVAEQWGRRWITIDTSRVALALARARIMGAKYPYYLLADSKEGQVKEAELTRRAPSTQPAYGNLRHGFVYERVPHITLKSIANNAEIDIIWENYEEQLAPLRAQLTQQLPKNWLTNYRATQSYDVEVPPEVQEWEVPRHPETAWPENCTKAFDSIQKQLEKDNPNQALINRNLTVINEALGKKFTSETLPERPADPWTDQALIATHTEFWEQRIARQKEIDASIAAKAESEYLYDKPYENKKAVRVAGPFTVESLSPHRTLALDEEDRFVEPSQIKETAAEFGTQTFEHLILDNLRTAGVQQAHKEDRITFESLDIWPGYQVCAVGKYRESQDGPLKKAGIVIGPEFGSLRRADLIEAAQEAGDAQLDVLVSCAFSYESSATGVDKHGRIPILKARMNADLHMAGDLKNTNTANLFVIFGEPDIEVTETTDNELQVTINGIDVFDPRKGEVRSDNTDGIACWMVDTNYNGESFFVRHAYFLGQNDPYKSLKNTLKAEINPEAWESLNSATSRPFEKPTTGRIAVKAINHLGDEVMKIFRLKT
ncbi:MAG: DNA methyltransferase [Verrucomicrobiota bacterium]